MRPITLSLLLLAGLLFAGVDGSCEESSTFSIPGQFTSPHTVSLALCANSDEHTYEVEVPQYTKLDITLNMDSTQGALSVSLYNAGGLIVAGASTGSIQTKVISHINEDSEATWYIKIRAVAGETADLGYTLSVSAVALPPCNPAVYVTAADLFDGTYTSVAEACGRIADIYDLFLPAQRILEASIAAEGDQNTLFLTVVGVDGNTMVAQASEEPLLIEGTGQFSARVGTPSYTEVAQTYTLTLTVQCVELPSVADGESILIGLNQNRVTASMCTPVEHLYRVAVDPGNRLSVDLSGFDPSRGDLDLHVYHSLTGYGDGSESVPSDREAVSLVWGGDRVAMYLIRVYAKKDATWNGVQDYTLDVIQTHSNSGCSNSLDTTRDSPFAGASIPFNEEYTLCGAHRDVFEVSVPSQGSLSVGIATETLNPITFQILRPGEGDDWIIVSGASADRDNDGQGVEVTNEGVATEQWMVEVFRPALPLSDADGVAYTLALNDDTPAQDSLVAPDADPMVLATLPFQGRYRIAGDVGASIDVFTVPFVAGSVVTAIIDFDHGQGNLDLAIDYSAGVFDTSSGQDDSETVTLQRPDNDLGVGTIAVHLAGPRMFGQKDQEYVIQVSMVSPRECPSGHSVSGEIGNEVCTPCAGNSVAAAGREPICTPCDSGLAPNVDQSACVQRECPAGQYVVVAGASMAVYDSDPLAFMFQIETGRVMLAVDTCVECAPGTVAAAGPGTSCTECLSGSAPNDDQSLCVEAVAVESPSSGGQASQAGSALLGLALLLLACR